MESATPESELQKLKDQVRVGFLWIASTTLLWQLVAWIFTFLTARILTPKDYGILALSDAIFPYLLMFSTLRLESWLVRAGKFDEDDEGSILSLLSFLGVAGFIIVFFASPFVARFYDSPEATIPLQILGTTFLFRVFQILPEARLRREMRFKELGVCNLVVGFSRGALQLGLASFGFRFWALVCGNVARDVLMTVWLISIAGAPRKFRWNKAVIDGALTFGYAASLASVLWVIFSTADNLVVGKLFGVEMLGVYSMAFFLADLPLSKLNTFISPLLVPYFSKLQNAPDALREAFIALNRNISAIVVPVLLGAVVTAPDIVPLVFGEHWIKLISPLQVLCIVGILRSIVTNTASLMYALNRPKEVLKATALTAATLPICFYLFGAVLDRYGGEDAGMYGIYAAWIFVYPLTGIIPLLEIAKKALAIEPIEYLARLRAPVLSGLTMCAGVAAIAVLGRGFLPPLALVGVEVLVGVITYPLALRLLFRRDFDAIVSGPMSLTRFRRSESGVASPVA